jgi:UDP-N-acetylglucosamine/UDP-N-acetylgalactosamine diphosphorylase
MLNKIKFTQASELIAKHGQEHLLKFVPELSEAKQDQLFDQILSVDFTHLASLYKELVLEPVDEKMEKPLEKVAEVIEPLRAKVWEDLPITDRAVMANQGMRALREGKVAAFLVAGGQGTRLGHDGPKGVFDIGLPSRKSLFQLQAERIIRLSRQAGKTIPWYIMTSEANHQETVDFFRDRRFFGLPERDIFFFKQGELPMVDDRGRILLAEKGQLALGPNGNGGCFLALSKSGALADMERRGITYVFFFGVDNALVRVCDPHFVGFAIHANLPAASKAVVKAGPQEKVGVLCLRNGSPSVLEYSEMSETMLTAKTNKGELLYDSANIATHLFTFAFLKQHATAALPYHVAHKKIAFVDPNGAQVTPHKPNGYKFELFMFDLFPLAQNMAALQVKREEEFAPVKNKDGVDSPASAKSLILNLHRSWALNAGLTESELENKTIEISPLVSYAGEGVNPALIRPQLGNPIIHVG